jgi:ribose transport system substrate-binding protein
MSRLRKSVVLALLTAGLALAVAACGGSDSSDSGDTSGSSGSSGKKHYTIAFIPGCTCDPYYSTETAGFQEAMDEMGMEAIVQGPANFDASEQTPVLQAVARRKPDAIIIDPTDAKAMIAPIRAVVDQGIPVMTTGNTIDADLAFTKIAASSLEGGRVAAETILELARGRRGPVLINNVKPGISSTDDRETGFKDVLEGNADLELLPTQFNNDDQARASSITSATLRAHPDLVGVFGTNVISAQGVANALGSAGKGGDVVAIGYDAGPQEVQALRAGQLSAVISQDPRRIGRLAVENTVKYLNGDRSIPRDQPLKPLVITRDSLDSPEAQAAIYR